MDKLSSVSIEQAEVTPAVQAQSLNEQDATTVIEDNKPKHSATARANPESAADMKRLDSDDGELLKMEQRQISREDSNFDDSVTFKPTPKNEPYRYDVVLWMFGILFICVLHSLIFGIGSLRGWHALTPYAHNSSNSSMERFLPKPYIPEPGVYKRSDKEASSRWYYWKLKPEDVTVWTQLFVWVCYALHNLSTWFVLYLQHRAKSFPDTSGNYDNKYTGTPDKYNLILFGLNAFFHLLHLLNTHTTYDGTAADTSEASSQSSVIVALILILFIEFRDRGVLFGYPSPNQLRKYQDSSWMSPVYLVRKYHGYFIYWAAIYTFWYHPMENTVGHVFGFTHTWFFMMQGSLTFTKFHLNRYWRFTLEVWVTIHSGVIAVQTGSGVMGKEIWPMFVFGFTTAIILTQLYGLPFWKNVPSWSRVIPVGVFVVVVVTAYSFVRDTEGRRFTRLSEIIRIPGILYLILLIGWLIIAGVTRLQRHFETKQIQDSHQNIPVDGASVTFKLRQPLWKEILFIGGVVLTYVFAVFLSWLLEYMDIKANLIVLTMIYCTTYTIFPAILGSFLLKAILPMNISPPPE